MARKLVQSVRPLRRGLDVNDACHGFTGQVSNNGNETMGTPKVFAVYWDDYFVASTLAVTMLDQYISTIINCSYMDILGLNYGINHGVFLGSMAVSSTAEVPENPMSEGQLVTHLAGWINSGAAPQPDTQHYDSLYVVLTPQNVVETFEGLVSYAPGGTGFAGYHSSAHFDQTFNWGKENLFYAVIPFPPAFPLGASSPGDLINTLTPIICHEMVEAFTDRNGNGWYVNVGDSSCEVCDICELVSPVNVFSWPSAKYYSNVDSGCVPGVVIENYLIYNAATNTVDPHGFPVEALAQINGFLSQPGITFITAAFTPGGGYAVVCANNAGGSSGLSATDIAQFETFKAIDILINLVAAPSGGWLFIGQKSYWYAPGFPTQVGNDIDAFSGGGATYQLLSLAFAPNRSWIIICEDNNWKASPDCPSEVSAAIEGFINNGSVLQNVVFFPNYSALIIGTGGDYLPVGLGFPAEAFTALAALGGSEGPQVLDGTIITGSQLGTLVVSPIQTF